MYEGEERCIQGFGAETCGTENTWKPMDRRKDNIKMHLQKVGKGAWTELIWLRIGTGGGIF